MSCFDSKHMDESLVEKVEYGAEKRCDSRAICIAGDVESNRSEILAFLGRVQAHYAGYHGRKEDRQWASVALFFAVIMALFALANDPISRLNQVAIIVVLISVFVFALMYMREQRNFRKAAGGYVAAALSLQTKILSGEVTSVDMSLLLEENFKYDSERVLPACMLKEVELIYGKSRVQKESRKAIKGIRKIVTQDRIMDTIMLILTISGVAWVLYG